VGLGEAVQNTTRDRIIDELYLAHRAAVSRVCSKILRNADDAADATQEVFLIALESLDATAKPAAARAWLLTVARNHCLDLLRRQKRLGKALVTLGTDDGRGTDMETAVADRDFVDIVFKQLSWRERQALWQSAVESRPLADIASRLRLSYMAAAQVVHRARRHAVKAAARVAVVFGIFQLGRQRAGGGPLLTAQRIATVAAVPLIAVSLSTSSPVSQAASAAPPAISRPSPLVGQGQGGGSVAPSLSGIGQGGGLLPPGSTATLNAAADTVRQLLRPLPSLPAVVAATPAVPSVTPLPSPPIP